MHRKNPLFMELPFKPVDAVPFVGPFAYFGRTLKKLARNPYPSGGTTLQESAIYGSAVLGFAGAHAATIIYTTEAIKNIFGGK